MNQPITYQAAVYAKKLTYKNYHGEENSTTLYFSLDPLQLMQIISKIKPKNTKSGNPAKRNAETEISEEDQLKLLRDLASQSAGIISQDGETWLPFDNFENTIAGKAFLTSLTSSDADRRAFSETVIIKPFAAFVNFAEADSSNTPGEVQELRIMLSQLERVFAQQGRKDDTVYVSDENNTPELPNDPVIRY